MDVLLIGIGMVLHRLFGRRPKHRTPADPAEACAVEGGYLFTKEAQ